MNLLHYYRKMYSLFRYLRGFFFCYILFNGKSKNLKVGSNVEIWGDINISRNVFIGSNVKIYNKVIISDSVHIGDNVEFRSNRGNSIYVGKNSTINRGTLIMGQIEIGDNCLIAPQCVVVGSNHNFESVNELINTQGLVSKGVKIGDNVWLGAHVTVLDGVKIGSNSIIGAGSVVTKDLPPFCVAVGNPCKVIKSRI